MPASTSSQEQIADPTSLPKVAAITMASNEADMLPRWVDYYGRELGVDHLIVLDDHSTDGSTHGLPCTVLKMPEQPWKENWERTRRTMANGLARALLGAYDVVIFTDVDEFLVPDPARHSGLRDYLAKRTNRDVIAPLGLNVLHNPSVEGPLDPTKPLLEQRSFVKFAPGMSKPLLKRTPADWMVAFHGIRAEFSIDPELLLLHLKFYDVAAMEKVAEHRQVMFESDRRGSPLSAWPLGPSDLTKRLRRWVRTPNVDDVPEFDAAEVDLTAVVQAKKNGFHRTHGPQLGAMARHPLRRLPPRYHTAL